MVRASSLKRLARLLHQTIQTMERRPDVDPQDPMFITLKCSMLNRALELRTQAAEMEAGIHLVDPSSQVQESEAMQEEEASA